MTDLRNYRGAITDALASVRAEDKNWGWRLKSLGKGIARIRWGYLDYIGQKGDITIRAREDDEVVLLLGNLDDEYAVDYLRDDDADDLVVMVGDKFYCDCRDIGDGIRKLIRNIAWMAHRTY